MRQIVVLSLTFGLLGSSPDPLIASFDVWTIAFSPGMPSRMIHDGYETYFDFPNKDGVHYIYTQTSGVEIGNTITMKFAIVGDGILLPTQREPPARVRLYLQRAGDTLTAAEEDKRWWSVGTVELVKGEHILTAVVAPENWSNVFGKNGKERPEAFSQTISHLANMGFTFGGVFAGHGVFVTRGSARFVLREFSVR